MATKLKQPKRRRTRKQAEISPTAREFVAKFLALPEETQGEILVKLFEDEEFREDVMDIATIVARRGGPTRPFDEFLAELRQKNERARAI